MRLFSPRRLGAAAAVLAAASLLAPAFAQQAVGPREELLIATDGGEKEFQVEIADDAREISIGLMFRRQMADNEGMLFDFGVEERRSFWMRNTYIPLDMLFIKADGTIESIAERTTPLSEKPVPSRGPVRFVLEINGGLSDTLGIEAGHVVTGPALEAGR
jgi:uncharacterized membrane protein (UPF0127 family)